MTQSKYLEDIQISIANLQKLLVMEAYMRYATISRLVCLTIDSASDANFLKIHNVGRQCSSLVRKYILNLS